ncbi:MAG: hypothetical protein HC893_06145, partial [Chloroflexaceae bacterium]|nr:hypothetical protein [Chloroflexaceae bacterium]
MSLGTLPAAMLDATSATLAEMPGVRAVALDAAWAEHIGQMRDQVGDDDAAMPGKRRRSHGSGWRCLAWGAAPACCRCWPSHNLL